MDLAIVRPGSRERPALSWLVLAVSVTLALSTARPYAGSWNDGSRLASVESLIDRHTFAIDNSVFVRVPPDLEAAGLGPFPTGSPLAREGTKDRLLIGGHYYSGKPPVLTVLMAGVYQAARWCGLPPAAKRPDQFCWVLTLATSGLAYVVAVWCVWRLGRVLDLAPRPRLVWTFSFAIATVALAYAGHVNCHLPLLAVSAALFLQLALLAQESAAGHVSGPRLVGLGTLAGLAYSLDLGPGPLLLACLVLVVAWRCRQSAAVALFLLGAVPWLAATHGLIWAIGGVFRPLNSVPDYQVWPGCEIDRSNMTGLWHHDPAGFAIYAVALLVGKNGFLGHNPALFLALPALARRGRRRGLYGPECLIAAVWCGGTWLLYAALSNNFGGTCCSVRWFVPLLAPAFFALALELRREPAMLGELVILTVGGAVLGAVMAWRGPWLWVPAALYWPVQAATLLAWLTWRLRSRPRQVASVAVRPLSRPLVIPAVGQKVHGQKRPYLEAQPTWDELTERTEDPAVTDSSWTR
jgi:hypothetical protein